MHDGGHGARNAERLGASTTASRASVDTVPTTVAGWDGESADDEPDATAGTAVSPPRLRATGNSSSRNPVLWALIGLATFVAVVVGALAYGFRASEPPADRRPEETRSATTAGTSATTAGTAPTSPSTQATRGTTTTTPTTATAQPPPTEAPPAASPAATCADLEARRQQIDEEKQQVEETYRDDPDTREALKRELEDEKQAIDAQRRSLGC